VSEYTIITTTDTFTVEAVRFRQDSNGDIFLYDEDGDHADPVAQIDSEKFVAISESENTETNITKTTPQT